MMKIKKYYKWREELLDACKSGDLNRVKAVISQGVNVNLFLNGHTTLTMSIANNQMEIANYLIANGFTGFNVKNVHNQSPLDLAINGGHYDFAKILIDRMDININCHTGYSSATPLMFALIKGNSDLAWQIIGRSDFDANAVDNDGNLALLIAIKTRHFDIAEYLIVHKNCNINHRNNYNETPLGLAIESGNIVFARFIAQREDCDINQKATNGNTPLMLAITNNDLDFADEIVAREDCHLGLRNNNHESALSLAIQAGMGDLVGILLDVDRIDINLHTSSWGYTPLMLALNKRNIDLAWKIVRRPDCNANEVDNFGDSALLIAIKTGYFDIAEYLIDDKNCDISLYNYDYETALTRAIQSELKFAYKIAQMKPYNINAKHRTLNESALSLAIKAGMYDLIEILLDVDGIDINLRTSWMEYTPMALALTEGKSDLAWEIVCRSDFNANEVDNYGNSALLIAIKTGHFDIAEYLVVHKNCNISQKNIDNATPLGLAIASGNIAFARVIAEQKNCDINQRSTYGNTPLMMAIANHHLGFANEIAAREDCNISLYNDNGETALILAIKSKHVEFACKIAQMNNCNINAQDNQKESALSLAIQAGMDDLVEILMNLNAIDINLHTGFCKYTPLMLALIKGNSDLAWKIIDRSDCHIKKVDKDGNSALLTAIRTRHFDIAKYLITHRNCDINQKSYKDAYETPLGLAIKSGDIVFMRFIAERKNCNINKKTSNGDTPLMLAITHNHLDFADEIVAREDCYLGLRNNNRETALILAIKSNHVEFACKIAQMKHCNINVKDHYDESALSLAIQAGMNDLIGILLKVNIDINLRTDRYKQTPMIQALYTRNTDLAWKIVCRSDFNVNKIDKLRNSALLIAIRTRYFDIAQYLVIHRNCYINPQNSSDETPLGLAIASGNIVFARFLTEQKNCNINQKTTNGNTPLTLALEQNQFDFAEELILRSDYRISTRYDSNNRQDPVSVSARTGHLHTFKILFNRLKKHSELTGSDNQLFRDAIAGRNQEIIDTLLGVEDIFKYAEMHCREYGNFVDIYVSAFIETINQKKIDFLQANPSGLFDIEPAWRRHVFYILRYLIRRGTDEKTREMDLNIVKEILSLPSMESIAHTAVTPGMENELLRLALRLGNQPVALFLVAALPEVARLAEENAWYTHERGGLNLRAVAEDKESSMIALSEGERKILDRLNTYYGPVITKLGGSAQVVEQLKQVLRERYRNSPAFIETMTKVPDDESMCFGYTFFKKLIKEKIILPFEKKNFDKIQMLPEERTRALQAYYRDCNHTAYRFLSKPNPLIHPRAAYVQSDHEGSYAYFEDYIPMIAVFFIAATDENSPPTDDFTLEGRFDLFISQLALIGRTHNWDRDEADDMEADMPSCNSGIHRRLFQSVMGHAFFVGLTKETLKLEIKDFVRQHFVNKINDANRQQISAAFFECHIHLTPNDESLELLSSINITDVEKREFYSVMASKYGEDFSSSVVLMLYTNEQFALNKGETHIGKFYGFANLQGLILKNAEQEKEEEKEEEKSNLSNQIVHSFRYRRDLDDATEVKFSAKISFKK